MNTGIGGNKFKLYECVEWDSAYGVINADNVPTNHPKSSMYHAFQSVAH